MYECRSCHAVSVIYHSMTETYEEEKCDKCEKGILVKKLANISFSVDKHDSSHSRPGKVVNNAILELQEELQSEKDRLKNNLWKGSVEEDE